MKRNRHFVLAVSAILLTGLLSRAVPLGAMEDNDLLPEMSSEEQIEISAGNEALPDEAAWTDDIASSGDEDIFTWEDGDDLPADDFFEADADEFVFEDESEADLEEEPEDSFESVLEEESEVEFEEVEETAQEEATVKAGLDGNCGPSITYHLDLAAGVLTLTGTGTTWPDDSGGYSTYNTSNHPGWYDNKDEIYHVVIGEGITKIFDYVFYDLPVLLDVKFPSSLEEIGRYAFYNCRNMKSVSFPESSKLTVINRNAFSQCLSLKSVSLPDNLTTLWYSAFEGDINLTSVKLPAKMTVLMDSAFKDCTSLSSVTFPGGLIEIGAQAFMNCHGLTSVTLPPSLKQTGSAFLNCKGLKEVVFTDTLYTLGANAFGGCSSLEKVTFNGDVNSMGMYAFRNCSSLKEIRCLGSYFGFGTDPFNGVPASVVSTIKLAGFRGTTVETCANTYFMPFKALYRMSEASVSGLSDRTYTGGAISVVPVVKVAGTTLKNGTDYALSYKNNKAVGTATVTITGRDACLGSISRTFKILPKGTSLSKLKKGQKKITVKWKKQPNQITGYQIQYSLKSNFSNAKTVKVKGAKKSSKTISRLKGRKKYYVRIRTYKTVGKTEYVSAWSKAKSVKTK